MIPPDQEIFEVEKRIAERRARVERTFRETGRQTVRALTSPWAIGAAAVLGFVVAGGLHLRHRHEATSAPAPRGTKAGAASSLAMAAATWFIKSQFGSPVEMARFVLSKVKRPKETAPRGPASRVPDRLRPSLDALRSSRRQATTAS